MEKKRSFEDLLKLDGSKWVYLATKRDFYRFVLDADEAGFTTRNHDSLFNCVYTGLVVIHEDERYIGFNTGFAGHMAFYSGQKSIGGKPFLRIDYGRFINGDADYAYKRTSVFCGD